MIKQERQKLDELKAKQADLYRKKRRYNFLLKGVSEQLQEVTKEIENLLKPS